MATCTKCETFWTTAGMTHCPVCSTAVDTEEVVTEPSREVVKTATTRRNNGTAVLEKPKDPPRPKTRPLPTPEPEPGPPPIPMPPIIKEEPIKVTMFPKPEKPVEPVEVAAGDPMGDPMSVDASVTLMKPAVESKSLPMPARPLNGPLILGLLAAVTAVMLPVTMAYEDHRIIGIIGFCLSGFFLPFAPIAWIAGLSAEKRRREQQLRPERRVVVGRVLGQVGTMLLVAEATVALVLIAGFRLAGSFPSTFWKAPQPF